MKVTSHPGSIGAFPFVRWQQGQCVLRLVMLTEKIGYEIEWPGHEESGEFAPEDFDRLTNLMVSFRAACLLFPVED